MSDLKIKMALNNYESSAAEHCGLVHDIIVHDSTVHDIIRGSVNSSMRKRLCQCPACQAKQMAKRLCQCPLCQKGSRS